MSVKRVAGAELSRIPFILAIAVFLLGLLPSLFADSQNGPGYRPDASPGMVTGLFRSHEAAIIRAAKELPEIRDRQDRDLEVLRAEHEQALREMEQELEGTGWLTAPWSRSQSDWEEAIREERADYQRELRSLRAQYNQDYREAVTELENLLASPYSEDEEALLNKVSMGSPAREQLETYLAAKNLRRVANKEIASLAEDPSDLQQAVTTYDVMETLLDTVIRMHQGYIQRIEQDYTPEAKRRLDELKEHRKRVEADAEFSARERELQRIDQLISASKAMLNQLPHLADRTEDRRNEVRRQKVDIEHFRETARLGGDIVQDISSLEAGFEQLELETPPTPDYELDTSQIELSDRLLEEESN